MPLVLLFVATVVDIAIAVLLVATSGFLFGSGPESMKGSALIAAGFAAIVLACLAAPVAGFMLMRRGKTAVAVIAAWLPPLAGLVAALLPAPY